MEAEIRAVFEAIDRAYRDRSAAAVAAHYRPDAVLYDLAPPLASRGMNVATLAAWLDTWRGPVDHEWRDLAITARGDLAFAHGLVRVSVTSLDGQPVSWWMRATSALVRESGRWKIAHEHTSVPFHMDGSFRAATDLEP